MRTKIFRIISFISLLFIFKFGNSQYKFQISPVFDLFLYQDWGFFTNNPLFSNLTHYKYENEKLTPVFLNTTTLGSMLGLKRQVKRNSVAFNFIYKDLVDWKSMSQIDKQRLNKLIQVCPSYHFEESRSILEKGIYITIKKETLPLRDLGNKEPRRQIYIFEVK